MFVKSETEGLLYNSYKGLNLITGRLYLSEVPEFLFNDIIYRLLGYQTAIVIVNTEYLLIRINQSEVYYTILPKNNYYISKKKNIFNQCLDITDDFNINKDNILGCSLDKYNIIQYIFTKKCIYDLDSNKIVFMYNNYIKSNDYFILYGTKCIFFGSNTETNLNKAEQIAPCLFSIDNIKNIIFKYTISFDDIYNMLYNNLLETEEAKYFHLPYNVEESIFHKQTIRIKSARKL